jgi:hypothetical protein
MKAATVTTLRDKVAMAGRRESRELIRGMRALPRQEHV